MFRFNTLGRYVHASLMLGSALALGAAVAAPVNSDSRRFVITAQETWQGMPDMHASAAPRVDALGNALMLAELDAGQVDALGRYVHLQERRCGGFFSFPSRAAAEAFLANDRSRQAAQFEPTGGYTIDNANVVNDWLPQVSELNIYNTISHLQAYQNRYYASATGAEAAGWIRDTWLALANGRSDVSAELFTACGDCGGQPSVILTIQGTTLPNEVVVLGGHLDSINHVDNLPPATERAPGADDDASGIASLTEILRVAMASNFRPQRTVKFMGYAAEEVGLNGSQAIAQSFQADGVNVVGALQLDMTNYHEPGQVEIEVINDFTSSTLNAFMGQLFDAYLAPLGMSRGSSPCGYACSDHASWTSSGYPSSFVFEGGGMGHDFQQIHSVNDLLVNMGDSAEHSVPFAQLGLAFLGEVAKGTSQASDLIFAHGFEALPNQPPTANFSSLANGLDVSFTNTSTDNDGSIVSHAWNFGDGGNSTVANPQHSYAVGGSYQVTLTVTDDDGASDDRVRNVVVSPGGGPLQNGVPVAGLSDTQGGTIYFTLEVPAGATNLSFSSSGGTGDMDLYVRRGSPPTQQVYDCRSTSSSSTETCVIASPQAGTWHVMLYAWSNYSGVTLVGQFNP